MWHSDRCQQVPFLEYNNFFCFHYQTKDTRSIWLPLYKWEYGLLEEGGLLSPAQSHLKDNSPSLGFTPYSRLLFFFILPQSWRELGQKRSLIRDCSFPKHLPCSRKWAMVSLTTRGTGDWSGLFSLRLQQETTGYSGLVHRTGPALYAAPTSWSCPHKLYYIWSCYCYPWFSHYSFQPSILFTHHVTSFTGATRSSLLDHRNIFPSSVKIPAFTCQGKGFPRRQGC